MSKIAIALALAVASCAGARRSAEQSPEPALPVALPDASSLPSTARTSSRDGEPPDAEPGPPTLSRRLELKEPGREPRRALRYEFAKGARQKLRMEIETRVFEQDRAPAKAALASPLEVTIVEVRADGAAYFRYELGPIAVSGTGAGLFALDPGDGGGKRLSGSAIIAVNGELYDHRIDPPAREDAPEAEVVKSLLSSVVELPSEPLGTGGRWELVLEAQSNDVALVRTTSYELSGFSGTGLRIRVAQNERVWVPDGGALNQLSGAPSAGEWLARPGRVFPEGKQTLRAAIAAEVRGELFTELRLLPR